jgi:fructose-1-phosphate kinase PfkB-like protein
LSELEAAVSHWQPPRNSSEKSRKSSNAAIAGSIFDGLQLICVTRGAGGSLLISPTETVEHRGFDVQVADTIGAGDAFTACLAHHYVRGVSLERISEAANLFAAWVVTQRGATPRIDQSVLARALGPGDAASDSETAHRRPDLLLDTTPVIGPGRRQLRQSPPKLQT